MEYLATRFIAYKAHRAFNALFNVCRAGVVCAVKHTSKFLAHKWELILAITHTLAYIVGMR